MKKKLQIFLLQCVFLVIILFLLFGISLNKDKEDNPNWYSDSMIWVIDTTNLITAQYEFKRSYIELDIDLSDIQGISNNSFYIIQSRNTMFRWALPVNSLIYVVNDTAFYQILHNADYDECLNDFILTN